MDMIFVYISVIGSWLLFTGAIYQAALELREEDIKRDILLEAQHKVSVDRHVSVWWWLLPPIKIHLEHKQTIKWRKEYFSMLAPEDRESLIAFFDKANGWIIVALGAALAIFSTTWSAGQSSDISWQVLIFVMFVQIYLSLFYTVNRIRKTNRLYDNS